MGAEVGWHLRFSREDEVVFLVRPELVPNVEDAAFIAGGWRLELIRHADHVEARARRVASGG